MCDLVARTGRHQQRYEHGRRLVAGCIPFRYKDNNDVTSEAGHKKLVEVLMINSQSGPGLLFPKGGWENDETVEEAAAREAIEEAGVRGDLVVTPFCTFTPDFLIFSLKNTIYASYSHMFAVKTLHPRLQQLLGFYDFKSKTHQDKFCPEGMCRAAVFALQVKEELASWPEQSTRKRSWLTLSEAIERSRYPWVREALATGFSIWHENWSNGGDPSSR